MDGYPGQEEIDRERCASGSKRGRITEDERRDEQTEEEGESGGNGNGMGMTRNADGDSIQGGDRAEIIRRRNCENARKARARKKMEVGQLEDQAETLKQDRARGKLQARQAAEMKTRTESLRKQTLRTFMNYRCNNVKGHDEWAEIVEENFTMRLPITPYRWFNGKDVHNDTRILSGIDHLMTDNGSLAVLIESLGCGTLPWRKEMEKGEGHGVRLVCDAVDSDIVMTMDTAMCCFLLRTTNAVEHGAKSEWRCRSMMWAKFSPMSNKLASISHLFDVNNLMQQLQKVVGDEQGMPVVPNTPRGACQPSSEARMIMTANPAFTMVRCNESWTKLCGYKQESILGQTLGILQGPSTDLDALTVLKTEVSNGRAASSLLISYKHDGSTFLNYLRIYPLVGDPLGTITHFLGVLQEQAEDPGSSTVENKTELQQPVAAVKAPAMGLLDPLRPLARQLSGRSEAKCRPAMMTTPAAISLASIAGSSVRDLSVAQAIVAKSETRIPRAGKEASTCSSKSDVARGGAGLGFGLELEAGATPLGGGANVGRGGTPVKVELLEEEGGCGGGKEEGVGKESGVLKGKDVVVRTEGRRRDQRPNGGEGGYEGGQEGGGGEGGSSPSREDAEQAATATDSKLSLGAKRAERAAAAERRRHLESPDNAAKLGGQGRQEGNLQPKRENANDEGEEAARSFTPPLGNLCRTPSPGNICGSRTGAVGEEGVLMDSPGTSLAAGNSLAGNSVDGGELLPDSFLGWEDFLVEPDDQLEDLEALHLRKGLDDEEVPGAKDPGDEGVRRGGSRARTGEDNNTQPGGDVRQRACSDSILAGASSSSSGKGGGVVLMERATSAWRLNLDGNIGMIGEEKGCGTRRQGASTTPGCDQGFRLQGGLAGRNGVRHPLERAEEDGGRSCRGVSDSAAIVGGGVVRGVAGVGVAGETELLSAPWSEGRGAVHGQGRRQLSENLSLSELTGMDVVPEVVVCGLRQDAPGGGAGTAGGGLRLAEPAGVDRDSMIVCPDGFVVCPSMLPASVGAIELNAAGLAVSGAMSGAVCGGAASLAVSEGAASGAAYGGAMSGAVRGAVNGAAGSVSTATLQSLSMFELPTVRTIPLLNLPGGNDTMGAGSCGVAVEAMPGGWTLTGAGIPAGGLGTDAGGTGAGAVLQESLAGGVGGGGVGLGLTGSASGGEFPFGGGGGPLLSGGQFASCPSAMDAPLFLQTAAAGGGGELGCVMPFEGQMTVQQQLPPKNLGGGGGGGGNGSSSQELVSRRPPRH